MTRPQQPEAARSGHTAVDPAHAEEVAETRPAGPGGGLGPVPPANRPGHHDAEDQDRPRRPAPSPGAAADETAPPAGDTAARRFPFRFDPRLSLAAAAFGVRPSNAHVTVDAADLVIRFGRWSLRTPLDNVASTTPTGPYRWWKIAGPAHVSLADRGVTFATNTEAGLCIHFHEPVPAALPTGLLRHPAATVTVDAPEALAHALATPTTGD